MTFANLPPSERSSLSWSLTNVQSYRVCGDERACILPDLKQETEPTIAELEIQFTIADQLIAAARKRNLIITYEDLGLSYEQLNQLTTPDATPTTSPQPLRASVLSPFVQINRQTE